MNAGATAVIIDGDGLKTNSGLVISSQPGFDVKVQAAVGYGVNLISSGGLSRVSATETQAQLFYGASAAAGAKKLETTDTGIDVTGTIDCDTSLQIRSTGSDVDAMPDLYLSNLEGAAAAQNLGMISFRGYNLATTPAIKNYADVYAQQVVVTEGGEEGKLVFDVLGAGAKVEALQVTKDGIDVTGGVTADYIDLTGGESTTTTGTIACKMLVLDDLSTTQNDASTIFTEATGTTSNLVISQADDTADTIKLRVGSAGTLVDALTASTDGIDVTGDLDVTGTITSNAFAYSKATVNNAADIAYTAFNSFAGKRIINTASATATTYGLPTPVAADIGKSWIICNPTDSLITIDHDASGTANYIWIMDGVTLSAAASSWSIKKGAIVEIVVAAATADGGGLQAPNYLIFGAGLLEI